MKKDKSKNTAIHTVQIMLFVWAGAMKDKFPELEMLFSVPFDDNKLVSSGKKSADEGLKNGVPDICLPISNGKFSSLWIKLKSSKYAKLTDKQQWWIDNLNTKGCLAVTCFGYEAARDIILNYLNVAED